MRKIKKIYRNGEVIAKLILFDWGWRDNIIYSSKAKSGEKSKGLMMIEKLRNFFNFSKKDEEDFRKKMIEMQIKAFSPTKYFEQIKPLKKFERDEKGNIISPFSIKKDEQKEDTEKP